MLTEESGLMALISLGRFNHIPLTMVRHYTRAQLLARLLFITLCGCSFLPSALRMRETTIQKKDGERKSSLLDPIDAFSVERVWITFSEVPRERPWHYSLQCMLKILLSQNKRCNLQCLSCNSFFRLHPAGQFMLATGDRPSMKWKIFTLFRTIREHLVTYQLESDLVLTMMELPLGSVDGRWSAVCLNETIGCRLTLQFCTADLITEEWESVCLSWFESPWCLS